METMVIFRGEVCWVERVFSAEVFSSEIASKTGDIFFGLVPVESASIRGGRGETITKMGEFSFLPSGMDFSDSEWSAGVSNGH